MELLIAERVRENRKRLGLTQEELAGRLGVSPQTVSYWENGGYPDITMLPVIANHFGITVDALMGNDAERIREDIDAFFNRSKLISSVEESFEEARAFYAKYPQERIIQSVFLQRFEILPPELRNTRRELAREVAGKILSDPWASPSDRGTAIMSMARTTAGEERQRWLALLTDSTACRKTLTEYSIVMRERGPEAAFPYLGVDRILGFRRALLSDIGYDVNPSEETVRKAQFFLGILTSFGDGAIPEGWLCGAGGLYTDLAFALFRLDRKEEGYDALRSALDCFSRFAAFPPDTWLDVGAPSLFRGVKVGIKAWDFLFPDGTEYRTDSFASCPKPISLVIRMRVPLASTAELRREPEYRRILSEAEKLIPEKIRIELAKEGTL